MKHLSDPLSSKVLISSLLLSVLITLFIYYDVRKKDYSRVMENLSVGSFSEMMLINNSFGDIEVLSETFDSAKNNVYVASLVPGTGAFEWITYQADYYFYPYLPIRVPVEGVGFANETISEITEQGDIVISDDSLFLDSELFSSQIGYYHITYVRK